jgi:hypothetical protein
MGKNSLLKSTSKKKKDEEMTAKTKKAVSKTKKAAPKAKAAAKAKAAPKAKAAAKAKAAPQAKKKPAVRAKKAAAPEKKRVSIKDLLHKKFDAWKPAKAFTVSPDKNYLKNFVAPPFFSDLTEQESGRIKEILFKKFDIEAIKADDAKPAAEKAAAEKAADEKATAEKAADEKAAAEKAADEKAAAEKAAAEKAAAEKAAEPEVSIACGPPTDVDTTVDDPMEKAMKYAAAVFVLLVALIIATSAMNSNKYYIKPSDGTVEIWQGSFSPMGEELLIMLPGVQPPETIKDVYSKADVYPLISNYYVEKADMLLQVPGMPDFEDIRAYLNAAMSYATSDEVNQIAQARLNNLDLVILMYKADVAASKETVADLEDAKGYLAEAARLDVDVLKLDLVAQKVAAIDDTLAKLKAEAAKAPAPAE